MIPSKYPFSVPRVPDPFDWNAVFEELVGSPKVYIPYDFNSTNFKTGSTLFWIPTLFCTVICFDVARRSRKSPRRLSFTQACTASFILGVCFTALCMASSFVFANMMHRQEGLLEIILSYYRILSTAIVHSGITHKIDWSLVSSGTQWLALTRIGTIMDVFRQVNLKERLEVWVIQNIPFKHLAHHKVVGVKQALGLFIQVFLASSFSRDIGAYAFQRMDCLAQNGRLVLDYSFIYADILYPSWMRLVSSIDDTGLKMIGYITRIVSPQISTLYLHFKYSNLLGMETFVYLVLFWVIFQAAKRYFPLTICCTWAGNHKRSNTRSDQLSTVSDMGHMATRYPIDTMVNTEMIFSNDFLWLSNLCLRAELTELRHFVERQRIELEVLKRELSDNDGLADPFETMLVAARNYLLENEETPKASRRLLTAPLDSPLMSTS